MGENFIRKQAKGFSTQRDLAHKQELETRTLFSEVPEIFEREYRFKPCLGQGAIDEGECLVVRETGASYLEVLQGNEVIGSVEDLCSAELRNMMANEQRTCGLLKAQVNSQSTLSGCVKFKILV